MYNGAGWVAGSQERPQGHQQQPTHHHYAAAQPDQQHLGLGIGHVDGHFVQGGAANSFGGDISQLQQQQEQQQRAHQHYLHQQQQHQMQLGLGRQQQHQHTSSLDALSGPFGGYDGIFGADGIPRASSGAGRDDGNSVIGSTSSSMGDLHHAAHFTTTQMDFDMAQTTDFSTLRAYAVAAGSNEVPSASVALGGPPNFDDPSAFNSQAFGNASAGHLNFQEPLSASPVPGANASGQGWSDSRPQQQQQQQVNANWPGVNASVGADGYISSLSGALHRPRRPAALDLSGANAGRSSMSNDLSPGFRTDDDDAAMGFDSVTPQAATRYTDVPGLQPLHFDPHSLHTPTHQLERPGSSSSLQGVFAYRPANTSSPNPVFDSAIPSNSFGTPPQNAQLHAQQPQQLHQYHQHRLSTSGHSPSSSPSVGFGHGSTSSSSLHAAFSQPTSSASRSSSRSGPSGAPLSVEERSGGLVRSTSDTYAAPRNGMHSHSQEQMNSFYSSPDLGLPREFSDSHLHSSPSQSVSLDGTAWTSPNDAAMSAAHHNTQSPDLATPGVMGTFNSFQMNPNDAPQQHPQPTTALLPDFDMSYQDHRLASQLANNASIGNAQANGAGREGGNTPTIMEEEEEHGGNTATRTVRDITWASAPSISSMPPPSNAQPRRRESPGGSEERSASGSRRSSHNTGQSQALGKAAKLRVPSQESASRALALPRRYRPSLRPSTFQQASNLRTPDELRSPTFGPGHDAGTGDCLPFIGRPLENYLATPSRLGLGERTVLIMTSKVAQKSYGAEKRFLCPPPMVLLIGSSWWSAGGSESPGGSLSPATGSDQAPTALVPPRLTIAISGESHSQDGSLEWASSNGRLIDVGGPSAEMAISGRCIGRQLYITDFDEKRRFCEAQVSISVPASVGSERRLLGCFSSKQIKVISKPSKKRQSSRNADLCVNHGSVISLFHRLRSQTVSTRYLCVSGPPTWFKGSDGQPFVNTSQDAYLPSHTDPPSCFVAKMSSWDPFVIYLVDPRKRSDTSPNSSSLPPPMPGYPPPPANALPMAGYGASAMPIYYNQPVVLQCLHTAVVSPIMIIRRVDKGTTVMGGSQNLASGNVEGMPNPSREAPGDPVSQLHKIALEVLEDYKVPAPTPGAREETGELSGPGTSGPFLACLNESVGMRKPTEQRRWVAMPCSTPTTPITPMVFPNHEEGLKVNATTPPPPRSPTTLAAAYAAAQTRHAMANSRHDTGSSSATVEPHPSSDGGKVKRPRRVSSSVVQQKERAATAAKNRRRGQSMSTLGMQNQIQLQQQNHQHHQQPQSQSQPSQPAANGDAAKSDLLRRTSSFAHSVSTSDSSAGGPPSCASWSVDVSDSDVWTIVGTDIARHTFYIPPKIVGGARPKPSQLVDGSVSHLITVPAPREPLAPIPVLSSFIAANTSGGDGSSIPTGGSPLVTLFGDNFTEDIFVYFGDWRSEQVEVQDSTTMLCAPPPSMEFGAPRGKVPISFVRKDGVIFPTDSIYDC